MKLYLLLAFSILSYLSSSIYSNSCHNAKIILQENQKTYKKYSGTIGNIPIIVDLIRDKNKVYGSYYYVKIGTPIQIEGQIKKNNRVEMTEFDNKSDVTGIFECVFVSESVIDGTWQNPKTKKTLLVKLQEVTQNYPSIKLFKNYSEDCDRVAKNKLKPAGEMEYHDTLCSTLTIETATIKYNNKIVEEKINRQLLELLIGKEYKTIEAFKKAKFQIGSESGFNEEYVCDPIMVDSKVISFSFVNSSYYFGAAHPNTGIGYSNFNLENGHILQLADLFIKNYKNELNAIGEKKFVQEFGREGWDFEPGKFNITENFLITQSGLMFTFNQYEIGPYSAGSPSFLITYKELAHLFNETSLLKEYYKK